MRLINAVVIMTLAAISTSHAEQIQNIKAFQAIEPYQVMAAKPRQWNNSLRFGHWYTASPTQIPASDFGFAILGLTSDDPTQSYQLAMTDGQQWQYLQCVGRNHLTKMAHWPIGPSPPIQVKNPPWLVAFKE